MPAWTCSKLLSSPDETSRCAVELGRVLRQGDCILLDGQLGSGKTHFARSLIQSQLDAPEDVPSPTFTLVQTYDTRRGPVWHADLYRISSVYEIEELGLVDAFETAICLVEWPDRLGDLTPPDALHLALTLGPDENSRKLTAEWSHPSWHDRLEEWCA